MAQEHKLINKPIDIHDVASFLKDELPKHVEDVNFTFSIYAADNDIVIKSSDVEAVITVHDTWWTVSIRKEYEDDWTELLILDGKRIYYRAVHPFNEIEIKYNWEENQKKAMLEECKYYSDLLYILEEAFEGRRLLSFAIEYLDP